MGRVINLYKPLSPSQLAMVVCSDWRRFKPDSPLQKVFYPKLNVCFAESIARQWDAAQYSAGYVVRFKLPVGFVSRFETQTVAYEEHREYKIPIADLEEMNNHIEGRIEIVSAFSVKGKATKLQLAALQSYQ